MIISTNQMKLTLSHDNGSLVEILYYQAINPNSTRKP